MAYKNIVFIKLERRLLNDYRWYQMSFYAQLLYVKLILFAAETYNKIPKVIPLLMSALRMELEIGQFKCALEEVIENFPKFKSNKHFYYFEEFEHKTNWLPTKQSLSNSSAIAQHSVDIDIDIDIEKDIEKDKEKRPKKAQLSEEDFLKSLKTNLAYKHIVVENELAKMDAWLSTRPGRQKTRRFIVNWLNKIDKPVSSQGQSQIRREPKANKTCTNCQGTGKFKLETGKESQCWCVS
jgi:hypothetical protein